MLFFDKVLSGNKNISCGTCHEPSAAGGDGLSLGLGEGASGLGLARKARHGGDGVRHRVPRNAPALFNLGALSVKNVLWDGRVAIDPTAPAGFDTPADAALPAGLDSVVAAQALFPILSEIEMAGEAHENEIALGAARSEALGWREIERRISETPAYAPLFQSAFQHVSDAEDIRIVDIANAIGAFVDVQWRADQSRFDAWLRGDDEALSAEEMRGAAIFFGDGGCAACHAGPLFTDQSFHAIAMPQIGPGKMAGMSTLASDFGRMAVTGDLRDGYRFRTPSLRNVAATSPYGHDGAYARLEDVVRHHLDPVAAFERYALKLARLPSDAVLDGRDEKVLQDVREGAAILRANELAPTALSDRDVAALLAFLNTLNDEASLSGRFEKPESVPSGLPVD